MGPIETRAGRARHVRKLFTILVVGVAGAGLLTSAAWGLLGPGDDNPLSALRYTIRARFGTDCAQERVVNATIGVPPAIDLGGTVLPDAVVELLAVPGEEASPTPST